MSQILKSATMLIYSTLILDTCFYYQGDGKDAKQYDAHCTLVLGQTGQGIKVENTVGVLFLFLQISKRKNDACFKKGIAEMDRKHIKCILKG